MLELLSVIAPSITEPFGITEAYEIIDIPNLPYMIDELSSDQ